MISSLLIYLFLSFLILILLSKISYKLNLVDIPNKRKLHSKPTAYTGGIALSIILLLSLQIFNILGKDLSAIISIAFLISIVGLIDDRYHLNIGGKLSLQIIPIFYLIVFEKLFLKDLGNYDYFALGLGSFSVPFSLLCVLFLINAFNYFDGIDGSLGFTSLTVLIILFFLITDETIKLLLLSIFLLLILFLFFNFAIFKLPKLFLGDSGSLLLGFIISFILILLAKNNLVHPILLAWSVSIFVYEFLSINLIRIKNKKDPFKPGLDHLHHLFLNKTKSIFLSNFLMCFSNIFLFFIGYFSFKFLSSVASLILFIIFFGVFFILRRFFLKQGI
tara:strand:- start:297 stop:1295 length:999 start_codon:yes stop_codon:yes gene_type:complete